VWATENEIFFSAIIPNNNHATTAISAATSRLISPFANKKLINLTGLEHNSNK